ncbi:hypothetical protein DIPPA_34311 [Diplonema papillatum]|nr:hypothetical protein DIPPA_34311 [Diplonema papillatum]
MGKRARRVSDKDAALVFVAVLACGLMLSSYWYASLDTPSYRAGGWRGGRYGGGHAGQSRGAAADSERADGSEAEAGLSQRQD